MARPSYFVAFAALRYVFSRSRLGAAGWISLISAIAIGVVTAALVCVLSVYNGYVALLLGGETHCMPELLIKPRTGSVTSGDSLVRVVERLGLAEHCSRILTTQALLRLGETEQMCEVYGVDEHYTKVLPIERSMAEGSFLSPHPADSLEGLSVSLGIGLYVEANLSEPTTDASLLLPRREGLINPLAVASAFVQEPLYISGVLPAYNEAVNKRVYMRLSDVQTLLNYPSNRLSALCLVPRSGLTTQEVQATLQKALGESYEVQNREEQQPELTLLIKTEKLMVYVIMCFILVLAAFNLASSLAMLIMEKRADIAVLRSMGAMPRQVSMIFAATGLLVSGIGSVVGLLLGLMFCLLQQELGFIASGEGASRVVFPIELQWQDLIYILLATFVVAVVSAGIPAGLIGQGRRATND